MWNSLARRYGTRTAWYGMNHARFSGAFGFVHCGIQADELEFQPRLVQITWTGLPDGGGHDMYPVPNSSSLMVATALHGWLFDRDTRVFTMHPALGDTTDIKSTSVHPVTGQNRLCHRGRALVVGTSAFPRAVHTVDFPGDKLYKAAGFRPFRPRFLGQLSIARTSTNTALVSWPAAWTNFTLQQNATLNSTNWDAPVESIGGQWHE